MYLFEAVNPLHGLPKHWIKYLAERHGKQPGSYYGKELAGESSKVKELSKFDALTIKTALKDENVIAIIGRKGGVPLFMIAKHYDKTTKYLFFEITPGRGRYNAKSTGYYSGRKNYTDDDYTMPEIMTVIEKMIADKNFSDITIETIDKDPVRSEKITSRVKLKSTVDPLVPSGYTGYLNKPLRSQKQKEIIKKYADLKRPKLDKKVDEEIEKIKKKVLETIDAALQKTIEDVKRGYSFSVDKKSLGEKITAQINVDPLQRLANAYGTLGSLYNEEDPPGEIARRLKKLGFNL